MKSLDEAPAPNHRQLTLRLDPQRVVALSKVDRIRASLALAHILMQAAGLVVEELGDDEY
jgi:hypothetical protein